MAALPDLLQYFEREAAALNSAAAMETPETLASKGYQSCIKFSGASILAPLVSNLVTFFS